MFIYFSHFRIWRSVGHETTNYSEHSNSLVFQEQFSVWIFPITYFSLRKKWLLICTSDTKCTRIYTFSNLLFLKAHFKKLFKYIVYQPYYLGIISCWIFLNNLNIHWATNDSSFISWLPTRQEICTFSNLLLLRARIDNIFRYIV